MADRDIYGRSPSMIPPTLTLLPGREPFLKYPEGPEIPVSTAEYEAMRSGQIPIPGSASTTPAMPSFDSISDAARASLAARSAAVAPSWDFSAPPAPSAGPGTLAEQAAKTRDLIAQGQRFGWNTVFGGPSPDTSFLPADMFRVNPSVPPLAGPAVGDRSQPPAPSAGPGTLAEQDKKTQDMIAQGQRYGWNTVFGGPAPDTSSIPPLSLVATDGPSPTPSPTTPPPSPDINAQPTAFTQPTTDFVSRATQIVDAAERAAQSGGTQIVTRPNTSFAGFKATPFPTAATPANQPATPQGPAGFAPAPVPTVPGRAAQPARPATFTPTAYNRPSAAPIDQAALGQRVEQELNVKYTPQREAILQASERARLAREQQAQELEAGAAEQIDDSKRQTASAMERAREYWGAKNLGSSGFLAGTQAQAQAAAVRAQGGIARDTERARAQLLARGEQETSQLNQQLDTLASLRGEAGASRLAQLNTEERQFRLQEANQALGEWQAQMQVAMAASQQNQQAFDADRNFAENVRRSDIDTAFQQWQATNQVNLQVAQMARQAYESDRGFQESVRQFGINQALQQWLAQNKMALDEAQLGLSERQVGMAEERQNALLPGETARQALLNRQTALETEKAKEMLPSDLAAAEAKARLAGTQASAANEDLYRSNEAYRQFGTAPQAVEFETAKLKRDAARLEYEIAQDPNIGSRAQKQAQLDQIQAAIRSSDALANQRGEGGGLTPYQQYQVGRDTAGDERRAAETSLAGMEKAATGLAKQYDVGQGTAELWMAFKARLAEHEAKNGPVDLAGRLAALQKIMDSTPLPERDRSWLQAMAGGFTGSLQGFIDTKQSAKP